MAIKIQGTTVVDDSRELQNIQSIDATTLAALESAGVGSGVEVSDTAPASPSEGDLWWDSTSGTLKVYYDDGTSQQWVDASPTLSSDFTEKSPAIISTPEGVSPAAEEEVALDETFTLSASAYSSNLGTTHASSDWQISTDPTFATTVVNVSADTSNFESYEVTGGISTENTFYWRVRYRDSEGAVSEFSTPIEFSVAEPFDFGAASFGDTVCGGIYMGQISAAGQCYALIVAPNATGCESCAWKTTATTTAGTDSFVDGFANTYGPLDNADHRAGNWCATRTINGFSDWYLPAIDELETFYNNGATGCNESVIGSGEAFPKSIYWSSTENSAICACDFSFSNGGSYELCKTIAINVRAVRREPI